MEERWKPVIEIAPNCPRCASSNTKFCYYNNYSLSQPRYFCKGCRRYWTKGGSLRNVPFGGGYRRTRRSKSKKIPQRESSLLSTYAQDSIESSPNGDSRSQAGADIDLAAVFANYLNHNPNRVEPDSVVEQTSDEKIERVQINMGNEVGEFGLENFVRDHDHLAVAEDVIWSDPVWEPMSNLQEIEAFSSTNLVNDIWSFFDSSGFEVFSQDLNLDG